jgi:hypothetical protein
LASSVSTSVFGIESSCFPASSTPECSPHTTDIRLQYDLPSEVPIRAAI